MELLELERTHARMKSYIAPDVLIFFLYLILYPAGFIANLLYFLEARNMEALAGERLPGVMILTLMLYLNAIVIALAFLMTIGCLASFQS